MALVDYANRKYDYLALRNVRPTGEVRLGLELFNENDAGQIAVGVQKLSQRWLLEFLTDRGSMLGLPNRGTSFIQNMRSGAARSSGDVLILFDLAAFDAAVNLQEEEDDTWPADERLEYAALTGVEFIPGYVNLRVEIASAAGPARSIILPISVLPQNIG